MPQCHFPLFREEDPLYITSFGIELNGQEAKWGPGRRTDGIIHYVLKGEGIFNGHPVRENQGFYIAPNDFCNYFPDPDEPWNYFWMNCSPEMAERYIVPALDPDENGIFDFDYKGKLLNIIERLFAAKHPMSCAESLYYAFSIIKMHIPPNEVSGPQHYVRLAKSFIESNIHKKITVYDVAEAVSVHDRYLYALFVQHEGISPKDYILKRKIETASDLLDNTSLSVAEIASAIGFPDVYSFSRLFKSKTGLSPSLYRKSIR